ncbi:MAG: Hsp20/alpha crystallin family protein, partial [Marinilabiliaceae bacterium]|nr:Hsp20/alpha crystallin family protein [Marinilabiliaceae bacterium]
MTMTLIRKYTHRKPETIHLFDSFFGKDFFREPEYFFNRIGGKPAVNIMETDNEYLIEVAAPGFKKEEFNIEVDKGVLTISADKALKNENQDEFRLQEFYHSSIKRSFNLPDDRVDEFSIKAHYEAGILE